LHKAGSVAARPRQTVDDAGADWVGDDHEHDRHGAGRLKHLLHNVAADQDDVRREDGQFRRVFANVVGIARPPAIIDPQIAAVGPAQLLQSLLECRDAGLNVPSFRSCAMEHADAPHAVCLLRAHRERPSCRRAAS
jgi:hypothetical protein